MKKDAYYFPHFCNARNDRKLLRVKRDFGVEGYGIYFMLLEVLREQTDFRFPFEDIDLLAIEFGTSTAKIQTIITKYDLFHIDEKEHFFSPKMILFLQPYLEKTERARLAARVRWDKIKLLEDSDKRYANADANAEQMQCESECKESKVKESKVKKIYYADRVSMTEEEYNKLITEYGEKVIKDKITDLDLWKGSKGKNTKSDYLTIKAWIRREEKEKPKEEPKTWGGVRFD